MSVRFRALLRWTAVLCAAACLSLAPRHALAWQFGQPVLKQDLPRSDSDNHPLHPLHEIDDAMIRLPLAARSARRWRCGRSAGARRRACPRSSRRRSSSPSSAPSIMLVVGASLARAFGIVGAANLIRYRSKIDDPKDAVVMLCALAVGLASGVGLYALAVFSTAFLIVALWVIESFEPEASSSSTSRSKPERQTDELRPKLEGDPASLQARVRAEGVGGRGAELRGRACRSTSTRSRHERDPAAGPRRARRGRVDRDEGEKQIGAAVKLIIQPDDGVTPLVQAVKRAKKTIDIVIFRFDRPELEKALAAAVARGVVVRALIAHTNRGGEKTLRKLELRLLEAGVTVARTADDLTRYHGKMMIVDDVLHVYGFNYTRLDIEQQPQLRHRHPRQALVKEASALFEADSTTAALHAGERSAGREPRDLARDPDGLHQARKEAAADLRRQGQRQPDRPRAAGAREGRRRDPRDRQAGEGAQGRARRGSWRTCACTCGPSSATARRRSSAARACASWSSTAGARSASIVTDSRIAKKVAAVFEADWTESGGAAKDTKDTADEKDTADSTGEPVSAAR